MLSQILYVGFLLCATEAAQPWRPIRHNSRDTPSISNGVQQSVNCSSALDGKLPKQIPTGFNFTGNVRTYYIAAEQDTWNYAPSGWDNWLGVPIHASPRATSYVNTLAGLTWQKALYRGYTDDTFTVRTKQMSSSGIQGPLIRAELGDLIQIYFKNNLTNNYASMHAMGLQYSKENEGSLYANTTDGSAPSFGGQEAVSPGSCSVYKWFVSTDAAPDQGLNSKMWSYHSFVNMQADINAGLVGPVIVYNTGTMKATMAQNREYTLLYNNFDESSSFLASVNAEKYGNASSYHPQQVQLAMPYTGNLTNWKPQLVNMPTVKLSSSQAPQYHSLNGYIFANVPAFEMCQDDDVLWYVYAVSIQSFLRRLEALLIFTKYGMASHVFHLHGNNFKHNGNYYATKSLNDGNMFTLPMKAGLQGVWQVLCHVNNHLSDGMVGDYQVYPSGSCPLPPLSSAAATNATMH